jgi:hypothetical protein
VFRGEVTFGRTHRRCLAPASLLLLAALVLVGQAPAAARAETGGAGQVEPAPVVSNTPFDRHGMWIWYVSRSEGGSIPAMIARAKRAGIGTVYIKSGDGSGTWGQFNRGLVSALHRGGLSVCAWQFVYGDHPVAEARVGAISVDRGADCLVIDAEGDYEGKYAAADRYIRTLRASIGDTFPLSLAAFPYVDYHPSFPYSVFLGPGGATYNQPQMYWKTIGTSIRSVYEHSYLHNRIWGHPIYPIGQTYEAPGKAGLQLFRRLAASYGGLAPSWWDWQETDGAEWGALGSAAALRPLPSFRPEVEHPLLKTGAKGDMVVWAQQHLVAAGENVPITGIFGKLTRAAVRGFQEERGMPVDGQIGTDTWERLIELTPYRMSWAARARPGTRGRVVPASRPLSASLPAKAYEIDPGPTP